MSHYRRKLLIILLKLSDILILVITLLVVFLFVRFGPKSIILGDLLVWRVKVTDFIAFLAMLLSWYLVFNTFGLYRSRRLENRTQEYKDILKATALGSAIVSLLAGLMFGVGVSTILTFIVMWLSSTILTISFRSILRYTLGKIRLYGRNLRFVLLVGTNNRAYDFARMIKEKRELGYCLLGFIDDYIHQRKEGIKVLGTLADFRSIIRDNVVDEVVITLPIKSYYDEMRRIVQDAEEQGIIIRYFFNLFDMKNDYRKLQIFDDFNVLTMAFMPHENWQYVVKRTLDVILAILLVVASLPLMLFIALLIKFTSRGPVFFIQERIGYQKRLFRLYKFRTMVVNAEKLQLDLEALNEMDGPVFKIRKDPRITKVGRWLRKTSFDELPQLLNVLKGDMSLVGPRPLPVRDYSGFNQDWQRRRFSVLPGITCTWQISGRNNISFEDWMKLDIEYVDTWKLSKDLIILFKTLPAVITRNGAV